jgi:hypothetical protein
LVALESKSTREKGAHLRAKGADDAVTAVQSAFQRCTIASISLHKIDPVEVACFALVPDKSHDLMT